MSFSKPLLIKDFVKNVDNYVSYVYKGHDKLWSLIANFIKNMLKNKDFSIKDIKICKHVSHETIKMPKIFTSETQKIGEIGENIAVKFLMKHGFQILDRNYTKKWGEIDIIAQKSNKIHFIEVKSVSSADVKTLADKREKVSRGTDDEYRPEDNMHPWKLKRLSRTIQTYLLSQKIIDEQEWQVDLLVVFMDIKNKKAKIKVVSDIIL